MKIKYHFEQWLKRRKGSIPRSIDAILELAKSAFTAGFRAGRKTHLSAAGAKGGSSTSAAKKKAAQENWKLAQAKIEERRAREQGK